MRLCYATHCPSARNEVSWWLLTLLAVAEPRDRSFSQELPLKFPGCSHFRRRSDNHHRCQQCRLNDGLALCTRESPCNVCRDWLPEAWQMLDKALKQKQKRKAAAAANAANDSMDDLRMLGLPMIRNRARLSHPVCLW